MLDEELYQEDVFGTLVLKGSARGAGEPVWSPSFFAAGAEGSSTAPPKCAASPAGPGEPGGVSAAVAGLVAAVDAVLAQVPAELPEGVALVDAAELLRQVERLRAGALGRIADVDARQLHLLDGAGSTSSWVEAQQTSLDRGEVALARRMGSLPTLDEAVRSGGLSVAVAERVGKALARLRRHVDRPDGLIDGQDGEQALLGVIGHGVRQLVVEALGGIGDDDPRLTALLEALVGILERPVSQLARLEAAFVLLAGHLEPHLLPGALGQLVDALLPNELEKRAERGHDDRGFTLRRKEDGSGWRITDGDLDTECGELLEAVLQAELAVDPDNPVDTAAFDRLRADGWQDGDPLPDGGSFGGNEPPGPRSLRQRRHDALKNGLRTILGSGALGLRDKVAPHVGVTLGADLLERQPGALPAVSTVTGARLPASLVRRWLCDSAVTRFVLSLGGRVLQTSHTERTLKPHERRIKKLETGGRCQTAGCRCGPSRSRAAIGRPLVPHHPDADPTAVRRRGSARLSSGSVRCGRPTWTRCAGADDVPPTRPASRPLARAVETRVVPGPSSSRAGAVWCASGSSCDGCVVHPGARTSCARTRVRARRRA